jgi:alkaline phosphatase
VILLIGDGMGDSEITLARYHGVGAEGTLNMETLPFAGELITYGLSAGPGPDYATNGACGSATSRKGFFLQVEGASIDKRDHASDVCGRSATDPSQQHQR